MKASKLFFGRTTFGHHIEVAEAINGIWYARQYGYNGYGKGWSKWSKLDEPLKPEYTGVNQYSGEKFTRDEPVYYWGFNQLTQITDPKDITVRLPNE